MVNIDAHKRYFQELEEQQQLSLGYYTTDEIIKLYAQEKFMLVIYWEVPKCLEDLKKILLNNYSLIADLTKKAKSKYPSLQVALQYSEGKELYELLIKWCKDWNICEDWMIENALITINGWFNNEDLCKNSYWYNNPEKKDKAVKSALQIIAQMMKDPDYPVPPDIYSPFYHKTKNEYLTSQKLYMSKVEEIYEKYGFRKTITKKGDPQKHFQWLVQYQLLNWDTNEILNEYIEIYPGEEDITIQSIKKEIRKTANFIGLNIR